MELDHPRAPAEVGQVEPRVGAVRVPLLVEVVRDRELRRADGAGDRADADGAGRGVEVEGRVRAEGKDRVGVGTQAGGVVAEGGP